MTHTTIHELMAEIDERVNHLKKLINYQEDKPFVTLRDNADGTCNCRPLMGGCFFTDGFDGRCDCKCHKPFANQAEEDLEVEAIRKAKEDQ